MWKEEKRDLIENKTYGGRLILSLYPTDAGVQSETAGKTIGGKKRIPRGEEKKKEIYLMMALLPTGESLRREWQGEDQGKGGGGEREKGKGQDDKKKVNRELDWR